MPDLAFLMVVGIILIILGFFIVAIGMISSAQESEEIEEKPWEKPDERTHKAREKKVKGGGVILIGPIPIVFGSDKRFALVAMILAIILMLLAIIFLR